MAFTGLPSVRSSPLRHFKSMDVLVFGVILGVTLSVFLPATDGHMARERRPNPRNCREAKLCCQGQNNTCFAYGSRVDMASDSDKCYCDSNCLIMGDCCTDYHHHCRSVDCQVSGWMEWTTCDNACGYGTRKRTRKVSQYPDNGGVLCPVLKQRRACVGYEQEICQQNLLGEQLEEKNEQARILPYVFGQERTSKKYSPWKGILKNLYAKHFNEIFTRATYRAKFQVESAHYGCDKSEWAHFLKKNQTMCVECQPVAMNRDVGMRCLGHGVYSYATKWKAIDVPHCHGTWRMVAKHQPKVCDFEVGDANHRNFIFI